MLGLTVFAMVVRVTHACRQRQVLYGREINLTEKRLTDSLHVSTSEQGNRDKIVDIRVLADMMVVVEVVAPDVPPEPLTVR